MVNKRDKSGVSFNVNIIANMDFKPGGRGNAERGIDCALGIINRAGNIYQRLCARSVFKLKNTLEVPVSVIPANNIAVVKNFA